MLTISQISKIYFDLDGVLSDFDGGVRRLCGFEPIPQGTGGPAYEDKLWTAVKAAQHFYYKLDILKEGKRTFDTVYARYPDKCEILTGIPRPSRGVDTASEDKIRWVRQYINEQIPIHTVMRKDKVLYCKGADCILIDDYYKNISEWNAAGGTGIHFTNAEDTLRMFSL